MKTLAIIAALLAVSIAAFLAYAATKPDSFRVERATSIDAPPEKVFAPSTTCARGRPGRRGRRRTPR